MVATLVCTQGKRQGIAMTLPAGRSLRIRLRVNGSLAGILHISSGQQDYRFQNNSQIPSELNGVPMQSGMMQAGDRLRCGEHSFELRSGSDAAAEDRTSLDLEDQITSPMELAEQLSREPHPDSTGSVPQLSDASDQSGRRRSGRRLSASRRAVVLKRNGHNGGILQRIRIALVPFKKRDDREEQLDALQQERDRMLRQAGRLALEYQGGFGLPAGFLVRLTSCNQGLKLSAWDLAAPDLERFRTMHQRLRILDAEIMSLRADLGRPLTEDLGELRPDLDHELHDRQERSYRRLDDIGTDEYAWHLDEAAAERAEPADGKRHGDTRVLKAVEAAELRAGQADSR
jgi:hypothetical protein